MTKEFALKRLQVEVREHAEGLNVLFPDWRSRPLFLQSVLVDMIYNMGLKTLGTFKTTLKLLKECNYEQAASNLEHTLWYSQVGNRAKENVWRLRNQMIQPEYIGKI
jgi:lysozyme